MPIKRTPLLTRTSWINTWKELGITADLALLEQLLRLYQEPHRHYHTVQHLEECLELFESVKSHCPHPAEVALAIWFHDAIYEPMQKENELQSALLAKACIIKQGLGDELANRVALLIMDTCHKNTPSTHDGEILVDIDLAILGATPERFHEYECQIRAEYAYVSEEIYRRERANVLQAFIHRPTLYITPWFQHTFEVMGHQNLLDSLAWLKC